MSRRFKRYSDWLLVAFVIWAAAALSPLSWWGFDARQVYVSDTDTETAAPMGADRVIRRAIRLSYSVTVRRVEGWQVACEATGGPINYSPDSTLPDDMDLAWWAPADSRCSALFPPGAYVVTTCWTASHLLWGLLPDKTVCVQSNVFQVREP